MSLDTEFVEDNPFAALHLDRLLPRALGLRRLEGAERPVGFAEGIAGGGDLGFGALDRLDHFCATVDGGAGVVGVGGARLEGIAARSRLFVDDLPFETLRLAVQIFGHAGQLGEQASLLVHLPAMQPNQGL